MKPILPELSEITPPPDNSDMNDLLCLQNIREEIVIEDSFEENKATFSTLRVSFEKDNQRNITSELVSNIPREEVALLELFDVNDIEELFYNYEPIQV